MTQSDWTASLKVSGDKMTGNEYADRIAAYLSANYGPRGLTVYREVSLSKSIIGKNRRMDILAILPSTQKAIGIECKYQGTAGTADEKIPYALQDLESLEIPAYLTYAGEGFSQGVLHMLQGSPIAAHCLPDLDLSPGKLTLELDHLLATTFGWWDAVLQGKQPFDLSAWSARHLVPERS